MSQQINLINPSLIRKKNYRTATTIACAYVTLMLLMALCYSNSYYQMAQLTQANKTATKQLQELQLSLDQANAARAGELVNKQPNIGLQAELAQLGEQQKMQAQLLQTMRQDGSRQHTTADYLRGFANSAMPGVWLTAFKVENSGAITLRGRCLQAALLPDYMKNLGRETLFEGRLFSGLRIGLASGSDSLVQAAMQPLPAADTPAQPAEISVPAFLEFELQGLQAPIPAIPASPSGSAVGKS